MQRPEKLPEKWVERIFARLLVRYGAAWLRMWEGVDEQAVKADWAQQLAGYSANPHALEHGLNHLPLDKPPTVAQFAQLCRGAPISAVPLLRGPTANPSKRAEVMSRVNLTRQPQAGERGRTVQRLLDRQAQGLQLTQYQRDTLRQLQALESPSDPI